MKKWIGFALVIVLLIGGYIYFFKRHSILDRVVNEYIEDSIAVEEIVHEGASLLVTHTIDQYDGNRLNSRLRIKIKPRSAGVEEDIIIPLVSIIERGSFEDEGENFDYAHIVTEADFSQLTSGLVLPQKKPIDIEHFVDSAGRVRGKYRVNPVNFGEAVGENLQFSGMDTVFDGHLFKSDNLALRANMHGLMVRSMGKNVQWAPFELVANKEGERCSSQTSKLDLSASGVIGVTVGKVVSEGSCDWDESLNSLDYNMTGSVDGLRIYNDQIGPPFEFRSGSFSSLKEHVGNGLFDHRFSVLLVPDENLISQFGVSIVPTELGLDYGFSSVPLEALQRLVHGIDSDNAAMIDSALKALVTSNTKGDLGAHFSSDSGEVKLSASAQFDGVDGLDTVEDAVEMMRQSFVGEFDLVADSELMVQSGLSGIINMLFGSYIDNNRNTGQSSVSASVRDGSVSINGVTLLSF